MIESIKLFAEWTAVLIELVGVATIGISILFVLGNAAKKLLTNDISDSLHRDTRLGLIKGILMGLEFLVAADIIHTVAVDFTFSSMGILAIVVLIRTFLSFTLELELTGRWPWQKQPKTNQEQDL